MWQSDVVVHPHGAQEQRQDQQRAHDDGEDHVGLPGYQTVDTDQLSDNQASACQIQQAHPSPGPIGIGRRLVGPLPLIVPPPGGRRLGRHPVEAAGPGGGGGDRLMAGVDIEHQRPGRQVVGQGMGRARHQQQSG